MTTIWKPRGVQKPSRNLDTGIRPGQLVQYLRDAQLRCQDAGEEDSAFRMEMLAEYFEKDYKPGQSLSFKGMHLGF